MTIRKSISNLFILLTLLFASASYSMYLAKSTTRQWLDSNVNFALQKIWDNISREDTLPGVVIAAKTKSNPNYYYHWVRDAGLTIDALISFYQNTNDNKKKVLIRKKIFAYLAFSSKIQMLPTLTGIGEPKFNVDGRAFNEPWGRPQNDSPALRAISLIHWANILIAEGKQAIVTEKMYDKNLFAKLPIKKDLEYVSHHWKDPSYDLWEEVKGEHFYTLMVSRRALLEGTFLARKLGDVSAADFYFQQAKLVEIELSKFWNPKQQIFIPTRYRVAGLDYKYSNIDCGVVLGLLHGDMDDGFLAWNDPRISMSINHLIKSFKSIYSVNQISTIPGVAIGRYPEDRYAGSNFNGGNPWPLCTLAVAEALYRSASNALQYNQKKLSVKLVNEADQFVERVRYHAHKDGSLNEQIERNKGTMTSVEDLTWNYAALITTQIASTRF